MFLLPSLLVACKPPPAPEGLDEASRYAVREFYNSDEIVGAGLTGFKNWFDDEGHELIGQTADLDNATGYTLEDLERSDLVDIEGTKGDPDPALTQGIVSVAWLDCTLEQIESYLLLPNQDSVNPNDFVGYDRTYNTSRSEYEAATRNDTFTPVKDHLDPLGDTFDPTAWQDVLLDTDNTASVSGLGVDLTYSFAAQFRHGIYEVQGEELNATLTMTWLIEPSESDDGDTTMHQSYGVEMLLDVDGEVLRMAALWQQFESVWLSEDDSTLWAATAVNRAIDASQRYSDLCTGEASL